MRFTHFREQDLKTGRNFDDRQVSRGLDQVYLTTLIIFTTFLMIRRSNTRETQVSAYELTLKKRYE